MNLIEKHEENISILNTIAEEIKGLEKVINDYKIKIIDIPPDEEGSRYKKHKILFEVLTPQYEKDVILLVDTVSSVISDTIIQNEHEPHKYTFFVNNEEEIEPSIKKFIDTRVNELKGIKLKHENRAEYLKKRIAEDRPYLKYIGNVYSLKDI